jgi:hypothetical protein
MVFKHAQSSPELQKLFGEDPEANDGMAAFAPPPAPVKGTMRAAGASKPGGGVETPRGFEEMELTEEELVKRELEKVKREREVLVASITAAREQAGAALTLSGQNRGRGELARAFNNPISVAIYACRYFQHGMKTGTAGGEAQQADIKSLRKEIELKKAKLNELKEESKRCEC